MLRATDNPDSAGGSPEECAALLLEVAPRVMGSIRRRMRAHQGGDLSVPQFRALGYIGRHPGSSLSAVAEHLGLSTAATSRLVDALVARGLVERAQAPGDRRWIALSLLPEGQHHLEAARLATQGELAAQLATLSPAARAEIVRALSTLRGCFVPAESSAKLGEAQSVVEDPGSRA